MIKVFVSQNPNQEPVASVFTFNVREDCDSIQESIKLTTAERNKPKTVADILKDGEEGLLKNQDVQMSLLRQDPELWKMFQTMVIGKQITEEQFWRARVVHTPPSCPNSGVGDVFPSVELTVVCGIAFITSSCY